MATKKFDINAYHDMLAKSKAAQTTQRNTRSVTYVNKPQSPTNKYQSGSSKVGTYLPPKVTVKSSPKQGTPRTQQYQKKSEINIRNIIPHDIAPKAYASKPSPTAHIPTSPKPSYDVWSQKPDTNLWYNTQPKTVSPVQGPQKPPGQHHVISLNDSIGFNDKIVQTQNPMDKPKQDEFRGTSSKNQPQKGDQTKLAKAKENQARMDALNVAHQKEIENRPAPSGSIPDDFDFQTVNSSFSTRATNERGSQYAKDSKIITNPYEKMMKKGKLFANDDFGKLGQNYY
jgi:hypothetical protein